MAPPGSFARPIGGTDPHEPHSRSFTSHSPVAEASIARDLADYPSDLDDVAIEGDDSDTVRAGTSVPSQNTGTHSLAGSYRRPSFFTTGFRPTVVPHSQDHEALTARERELALEEERALLADNNFLPAEYPHRKPGGILQKRISSLSSSSQIGKTDRGSVAESNGEHPVQYDTATERTALLQPPDPEFGLGTTQDIDKQWEEAVAAGLIQTTWRREARVIGNYSAPLILTFLLQYSLTVASIFTVGHLGKVELGAVSLANMTANITGYAVYQGLATSLDTLCAQAYGSGKKKLVGLQMQRMVYFLWFITIPIGLVWFFADIILMKIIPDQQVAVLAGKYMKVVLMGAPGYACFESGKRYLQAQGLFSASLYVLLVCAPLNAFMNWLFVWHFDMGFIGAPVAVAITDNLLPACLFLYVYFVAGRDCWNGFTTRALLNWGPMIRLALPGLVMVLAEFLAFEILTLVASYLGTTELAVQSVLSTIISITYQIPFPVSIAGSTRIANLIGGGLADAARTTSKVVLCGAIVIGIFNITFLSSLRNYIPQLFTSDAEVAAAVSRLLPLCAAFQVFDAIAANCNGILRGLGWQEIGGYVQLFCYYVVALPVSIGTAFGLHWGLWGLWIGVATGLALVSIIELWFLHRTDYDSAVQDAARRNAMS